MSKGRPYGSGAQRALARDINVLLKKGPVEIHCENEGSIPMDGSVITVSDPGQIDVCIQDAFLNAHALRRQQNGTGHVWISRARQMA